MIAKTGEQNQTQTDRSRGVLPEIAEFRHVLACVDTSPMADTVAAYACALAQAMHAPLTVLHAQDTMRPFEAPVDPVAWELSRRDTQDRLTALVDALGEGLPRVDLKLVDGPVADCICRVAQDRQADLIVMGARSGAGAAPWGLGGNVHKILEGYSGSMMVVQVPPDMDHKPLAGAGALPQPQRVMVPLDCSRRAETALGVAQRIARVYGADLVLAHALPRIEMTSGDALDAQDMDLREQITRRNERVARAYLDRIRARTATHEHIPRIKILRDGPPRPALLRAIDEEHADLLVLSGCGEGGHTGAGVGSTAEYLIAHTTVPVLLVRNISNGARRNHHEPVPPSRQPRPSLS